MPSAELVHRIHDRYLVEVVEELGLCPFARRSRELGRVRRPLRFLDERSPDPGAIADLIAETTRSHPDVEIILVTFVDRPGHFARAASFEAFVAQVREADQHTRSPEFFMVGFHPRFGNEAAPGDRGPTPEGLVPSIRRTPDPVIQCVRISVLERARAQAQRVARQRLLDSLADADPRILALAERSVQTDSELSADIARTNFAAVGTGAGRDELEARIASILAERNSLYGF